MSGRRFDPGKRSSVVMGGSLSPARRRLDHRFVQLPRHGEKSHIQERAVEGGGHVALRIPHVALMTDQGSFQIGMRDLADPGLDDLPEGAESEHGHYDHIREKPACGVATSPKDFHQRQREEKAETEMHDTVEMIAMKVEPSVEPQTDGNLWIGVMHGNRMQGEPNRNENVRGIREWKRSIGDDERGDEQKG